MSQPEASAPAASESNPVVTLFESYGSGADQIGRRVAEQLGLPYREQAFSSSQLDPAAPAPEEGSILARVFSALGQTGYGASTMGDVEGSGSEAQRREDDLVRETTRIVQEYAAEGGVIVGRNGAVILKDHPAALHVRLDGPVEQRISRAAAETNISRTQAVQRQEQEDRLRAEMSQRLYEWDPRGLDHYDMVLNTGQLDLDMAAAIIVQAVRMKSARLVT